MKPEDLPEAWRGFMSDKGTAVGISADLASKTSLVSKLAEVMAAVGRIPKKGRNAFHGYDYAQEADIVEAIRGELAKRSIMLIPGIVAHERIETGKVAKSGGLYAITVLTMEFTFVDGVTGQELVRKWVGAGIDAEDKGLYKAMTGAEKYFLMKTFLLPTGDDPERDNKEQAAKVRSASRKDALIADIKSQTKVDLKTGEELPDTTLAKDCPKGAALVVRYQYENGWHHGWLSLPDTEGQVKSHEVKTKRDLGLQLEAAYQSQKPVVARWNDKGLLTALDWYVPAINGPIPEKEVDEIPF